MLRHVLQRGHVNRFVTLDISLTEKQTDYPWRQSLVIFILESYVLEIRNQNKSITIHLFYYTQQIFPYFIELLKPEGNLSVSERFLIITNITQRCILYMTEWQTDKSCILDVRLANLFAVSRDWDHNTMSSLHIILLKFLLLISSLLSNSMEKRPSSSLWKSTVHYRVHVTCYW